MDYVINPKTKRPVKIGSRKWVELVKEGIYENTKNESEEVLYDIEEGDDIELKKVEIDKKLPKTKQAVRGRGRHKGKLVVRKKPVSMVEVHRATRKAAAKAISANDLVCEDNEDDIEARLEQLILDEMASNISRVSNRFGTNKQSKGLDRGRNQTRRNNLFYEVDEGGDVDEVEDVDEDEGDEGDF